MKFGRVNALHVVDMLPGGANYAPDPMATARAWARETEEAADRLVQIGVPAADMPVLLDLVAMLRAGGAVRELAREALGEALIDAYSLGHRVPIIPRRSVAQ